MSSIITDTRVFEARATLLRLERLKPSEAAPLTDEDLAIFIERIERHGNAFNFYCKASYLDYFYFYSAAVGQAVQECEECLPLDS